MAAQSRPKDGVASLAYVPAIHVVLYGNDLNSWMPATSAGMTKYVAEFASSVFGQALR